QKIEDTGPLTRKRMETIDKEVLDETLKWMDANGKGDKPFFVWFNSTAIHIWSHPNPKYIQMAVDEGRAEEDVVRARMIEHDEHVGALLKPDKLASRKNCSMARSSAIPPTRSISTATTTPHTGPGNPRSRRAANISITTKPT